MKKLETIFPGKTWKDITDEYAYLVWYHTHAHLWLKEKDQQIADLRDELETAHEAIDELTSHIFDQDTENERLCVVNQDLRSEIRANEAQIRDFQEYINTLTDKLVETKQKLHTTRMELNELWNQEYEEEDGNPYED